MVAFVEGFVIVQLFAIDLPEPVAIAALIGAFDGSAGGAPSAAFSAHLSARLGPGPSLTAGLGITGLGWLLLAVAPLSAWGVAAFAGMLVLFGFGAVLVFINFLALRQAVTPQPLLGRMTSTMRWLSVLPAGPGALLGGWLGEHVSLRAALAFAGGLALLSALVATRLTVIRADAPNGRSRRSISLPSARALAPTAVASIPPPRRSSSSSTSRPTPRPPTARSTGSSAATRISSPDSAVIP